MTCKHLKKCLQKYQLFFVLAIFLFIFHACSTKRVPKNQALLTRNKFEFTDGKLYANKLSSLVSQKPNSKASGLFLFPVQLWLYNLVNPQYDSVLAEYMSYPSHMRNQKLRDSISIKQGKNKYIGKNMWLDRFFYALGKPPVILDPIKTTKSEENIRKFFVYKGYWNARIKSENEIDYSNKKAQVKYTITHNKPVYIGNYYYDIPYPNIKEIYLNKLNESFIKSADILDQEKLEKETERITNLMRSNGYYTFNRTNEEIFFTADTLRKNKLIPLSIQIKKSDSTPYRQSTIGSVNIYIVDKPSDTLEISPERYKSINIFKKDDTYRKKTFWSPIIVEEGQVYNQNTLELTRRNIIGLNNFTIINSKPEKQRKYPNDDILDITYLLKPLPKYQLKGTFDLHYSQILNFGFSPSIEFTARNVFHEAENLGISFSGIIGTTQNTKAEQEKKIFNAYEISAQANLSIPKFSFPFLQNTIPKSYSPSTVFSLGISVQKNIGLGRINFLGGIHYNLAITELSSHRITLFNTQFSFTQNKEKYYTLFPKDNVIRDKIFTNYFMDNHRLHNDYLTQKINADQISRIILKDYDFQQNLNNSEAKNFSYFRQSLLNKDRQTQDVLICSILYNFIYNEIGRKAKKNPLSINAKIELAGNTLSLISTKIKDTSTEIINNDSKTIFKIPYSQFVKFDIDFRKYFTFFHDNHTIALRQFIGIGIPYGNSSQMPFIRSYYNGGAYDIRAWKVFGGLGPASSKVDPMIRAYSTGNIKFTSSIEYRFPINDTFHGAIFTDAGNTWNIKENSIGDQFKFNKFLSQIGIGSGLGLRINIAYVTLRVDIAYPIYNPNMSNGEQWQFKKIKPLRPVWNLAFGLPF